MSDTEPIHYECGACRSPRISETGDCVVCGAPESAAQYGIPTEVATQWPVEQGERDEPMPERDGKTPDRDASSKSDDIADVSMAGSSPARSTEAMSVSSKDSRKPESVHTAMSISSK